MSDLPDWTTDEEAPVIRAEIESHMRATRMTIRQLERLAKDPVMAREVLMISSINGSLQSVHERLKEIYTRKPMESNDE